MEYVHCIENGENGDCFEVTESDWGIVIEAYRDDDLHIIVGGALSVAVVSGEVFTSIKERLGV